ncbi:MAG: PD-(D/E)XK nuclease family transposase, partial [Clostridium sp.]
MPSHISKYINPLTDYGFKKLFGEEGSKHLLVNFLNDILPIKDKILSLEFKQNEHQGDRHISRK